MPDPDAAAPSRLNAARVSGPASPPASPTSARATAWSSRLSAAIAVACLLAIAVQPARAQGPLDDRIAAVLDEFPRLRTATVAVRALDTDTGAALASLDHQGGPTPIRQGLIPASNMKLLTTGAALHILPEDFAWRTRLLVDGSTVYIVGSGDPGFGDPELLERSDPPRTADEFLDWLAEAVRSRGVDRVDELVLDDRAFEPRRIHPTWKASQLNRGYSAEVGGFNFHANVLLFSIRSQGAGRVPRYTIDPLAGPPPGWLQITNLARGIDRGRNTVWISRSIGSNRMTLRGNARSAVVDVALHDAPLAAARIIAARMPGPGGAQARRIRSGEAPPDPENPANVAAVVRTPLRPALERINTDSANLYAEALLKTLGRTLTGEPGSWTNGAAAVRMVIQQRLGPDDARRVSIADGSGYSRDNRVHPGTLARWLLSLANDPEIARPFMESLPEVGEGTLRRRFRGADLDTRVLAKSGTLDHVRCLSGYVVAAERTVAFVCLVNDLDRGSAERDARLFHERVVELIDESLAEQAGDRAGG